MKFQSTSTTKEPDDTSDFRCRIENNSSVFPNLSENITYFTNIFKNDRTLKKRLFSPTAPLTIKAGLIFVDGLVNDLIINQNIIAPVVRFQGEITTDKPSEILTFIEERILFGDDISRSSSLDKIMDSILTGDTVIFIDGVSEALIISTKSWAVRSVDEPDSEKVMNGPHEGFTESVMLNLSLIRRRITNRNLRYEFYNVGRKSKTVVCLCFMEGLADSETINTVRAKIKAIDIDCILDTEYIEEIIHDGKYSIFKTTGSTERPDVVSAKLLEGRIAILINGSPVAATLPFVFLEYFQNPEDYYSDAYYASFNRILRLFGFFAAISLPAIYLSLVIMHQEMLPLKFLMSAAQSRTGMPMSSFCEIIVLIITFELVREGSARIPSNIGSAFSIVGGIVLGQAAVEANFVSLPIVIIVSFTVITGMIVPQLKGPVIFLRFLLVILADIAGMFGYMLGMLFIIFTICSIDSFSIPYTSLTSRDFSQAMADTIMRSPWKKMRKRPLVTDSEDVIRQQSSEEKDVKPNDKQNNDN